MITIIIPLYNKEKSIVKTLESVRAQTFSDYECLIVNDGSTDGSPQIVSEYCTLLSDKRFRIIDKSNSGVCSARNRGIKEAAYNIVAFLDADDLWESNFLEEMVSLIKDYPEAYLYSSNFAETVDKKIIRKVPTGLPANYRGIVEHYFEMPNRISDLVCSSSAVVRKDVFEVVGYFDERLRYAEDTDMWWRIIACHPFAFFDKCLVSYQFDAENRAQKTYRSLDAFLPYYIDKYQDPLFRSNDVFYRWANCWATSHIRKYYFSKCTEERFLGKKAALKLDYSVIPHKYKLLYGTPYPIAWLLNQLDKLYHKL